MKSDLPNPALQAAGAHLALDGVLKIQTMILQTMSSSAPVPELGR